MKRKVLMMLAVLLGAACSREPLFPGYPRYRTESGAGMTGRSHNRTADEKDTGGGRSLYLTAVSYPKDYPWQQDEALPPGENSCQLLLLKDGTEILRIPAGGSEAPDRHRCRGGHLWTDRTENGKTILSRDGKDQIAWKGEESLKGFLLRDEAVYTLGQRVGGVGISLRKNGTALFEDSAGMVMGGVENGAWEGGALSMDGQELCFCYAVPLKSGEDYSYEYRFVRGGKIVKTLPGGTVQTLYDWRCRDGILYWCATLPGGEISFASDDHYVVLRIAKKDSPHLVKLLPFGPSVLAAFYQENPLRMVSARPSGELSTALIQAPVFDFYTDGERVAWVETETGGRVMRIAGIPSEGTAKIAEGSYRMVSPACGSFSDGRFIAALTSLDSAQHLVLVEDQVFSFSFNGYFSSVRTE